MNETKTETGHDWNRADRQPSLLSAGAWITMRPGAPLESGSPRWRSSHVHRWGPALTRASVGRLSVAIASPGPLRGVFGADSHRHLIPATAARRCAGSRRSGAAAFAQVRDREPPVLQTAPLGTLTWFSSLPAGAFGAYLGEQDGRSARWRSSRRSSALSL